MCVSRASLYVKVSIGKIKKLYRKGYEITGTSVTQ